MNTIATISKNETIAERAWNLYVHRHVMSLREPGWYIIELETVKELLSLFDTDTEFFADDERSKVIMTMMQSEKDVKKVIAFFKGTLDWEERRDVMLMFRSLRQELGFSSEFLLVERLLLICDRVSMLKK